MRIPASFLIRLAGWAQHHLPDHRDAAGAGFVLQHKD
jgi:hypothetical protein